MTFELLSILLKRNYIANIIIFFEVSNFVSVFFSISSLFGKLFKIRLFFCHLLAKRTAQIYFVYHKVLSFLYFWQLFLRINYQIFSAMKKIPRTMSI